MADGAAYDININAKANGLSSASSQLNSLADALEIGQAKYNQLEMASTKANQALEKASMAAASVEKLAAAFENASAKATAQASAVEAAKSNLAALAAAGDTSAAALATAGAAVDAASAKYASLTTNAGIAERALAKATKSGSQVGALTTAAEEAAAAVKSEAAALDELKAAAASAAPAVKKSGDEMKSLMETAKGGLGPMNGLFERFQMLKTGGPVAAIIAVEMAIIGLGMAAVAAVAALAKLAVTVNEKAMKKITAATEKAKGNFAKLFSGVGVDKFVSAYESVLEMLDESSSAAQAVKEMLSTILNPIFDMAPGAGDLLKGMLKGFIIAALQAMTVAVLLSNEIDKIVPEGTVGKIDYMAAAILAGKVIFYGLIAVVAVAAVVMLLFAAGCAIGALMLLAIPIAIVVIIAAIVLLAMWLYSLASDGLSALGDLASGAADFLSGMADGALEAGSNLIAGLVNGITSGTGAVIGAIKSMASAASGALVNAFKIGSPSKLFFEYGGYTAEGLENGITAGTSGVTSAMETMATPPDALESGEMAGKKTGGSSSGKGANITGNTFQFYGVKDAADAESKFGSMLTRLLEGDVLSLGGEVPA